MHTYTNANVQNTSTQERESERELISYFIIRLIRISNMYTWRANEIA